MEISEFSQSSLSKTVNGIANKTVLNVAFYRFQRLEELALVKAFLKNLCLKLEIKGTVLVSSEGLNGSLAGLEPNVRQFMGAMQQSSLGQGMEFKESFSTEVPFKNLFIKIKKEIIPVGDSRVQPEKHTSPRISALTLKNWLDQKKDIILLDTRNYYEIAYGTFKGATSLDLRTFRDFRAKLKTLSPQDREKPMVMFCTGGIRCEKASVLAEKEGFKEVYQLDGGILKYFEELQGAHYDGACFVFDERVALDPALRAIDGERPSH